ncbi:hypothetical protein NDU88_001554 [Pleurodeles waltl]|uniref:Uncharacterized protein n=1 Tax=Pleurodeles waltl TaxID=8319 RepID=A0AAV7KQJ0_PLEWA|nr:hypothetical protein NDU88_001554 [Pleurodeles waltl]
MRRVRLGKSPRTTIHRNREAGPRTGHGDSHAKTAPPRIGENPRAHSKHPIGSSQKQEKGRAEKRRSRAPKRTEMPQKTAEKIHQHPAQKSRRGTNPVTGQTNKTQRDKKKAQGMHRRDPGQQPPGANHQAQEAQTAACTAREAQWKVHELAPAKKHRKEGGTQSPEKNQQPKGEEDWPRATTEQGTTKAP